MEVKYFLLITILLFGIVSTQCSEDKNSTIRVHLIRQTTPFEQHLNAPNLEDYGIGFEWLNTKYSKSNRTNDSIALRRYLDNEFYAQIVIGHPGQILNVAFDTAWTESWVISSRCNSIKSIGCFFHNKYDHTKSSEYKADGRPYFANEGTYNLTGFFSYDNISIAHSNVTNQSFIEMTSLPNNFVFNKIDGILGLGLQVGDYEPFFYKLLRQKKIKNPLFSIYLNRDRQSDRGGNIMLGFVDLDHIHKTQLPDGTIQPDEITYLPVEPGQYWQFKMDSIIIDKNTELCAGGCKAISDTSSNTIMGPADKVATIHTIIKASESWMDRYMVTCDTVNKLPKIDFIINGKNFTLKGTDYILRMSKASITYCVSAFVANPVPEEDFWVLGGAFLSSYYTIYNIQEKLIGIVKAAA